jgi:predicted MPP superfamily phosphohydrolase
VHVFGLGLLITIAMLAVVWGWAVSSFPRLARRRRTVALALGGIVLVQLATRWMVITLHSQAAALVQTAAMVAIMTMAIAGLPLALIRLVSWVTGRLRGRRAAAAPVSPAREANEGMTRRQLVEAVGGSALLGSTGAMLGWGVVRGRHDYQLREIPVRIAGLPRALDGYTIAQVSDIHAGTYVGERELDEGLALVRRAHADLLVVTGDLVDFDPAFAPLVARKLMDVAPRDGVTAILGNHDDYAGADAVGAAVRAAGIDLLVNEGRRVRAADGGGFALLGVDDQWSHRYGRPGPRLDVALEAVPADLPRVLLSHQPATVDRWAGQVALQLSGHTHGGQINPGFRPADLLMAYVAGVYPVRGTTLYVNSGFGTVGPPARVGAPPEVTRIVLVAA